MIRRRRTSPQPRLRPPCRKRRRNPRTEALRHCDRGVDVIVTSTCRQVADVSSYLPGLSPDLVTMTLIGFDMTGGLCGTWFSSPSKS